jgi:plasmid stability protein
MNASAVMKHLTVRNVPEDLGRALEREKRRRGTSLNQTVLDLLRQALGVGTGSPKSNGLAALAGGWAAAERRTFEASIADTEQIDEDLWR